MVGRSVCLCLSVGYVRKACKDSSTEPIEMPFGRLTRVGPKNHILDGVRDPQGGRTILGLSASFKLKNIGSLCCLSDRDAVSGEAGLHESKEPCIRWGRDPLAGRGNLGVAQPTKKHRVSMRRFIQQITNNGDS